MANIIVCQEQSDGHTVCLDANFGLVRKKNAGKDVSLSTSDATYFVDDEVVRSFTNDYEDSVNSNNVSLLDVYVTTKMNASNFGYS